MSRLANLLEAERARRDLTLTDFARGVLGIDHSLVSRYINGKQSPGRKNARKIAERLEMTVSEIDAMLADDDAQRRGAHKPGLGPTGHPDDLDLAAELRGIRAELVAIRARLGMEPGD